MFEALGPKQSLSQMLCSVTVARRQPQTLQMVESSFQRESEAGTGTGPERPELGTPRSKAGGWSTPEQHKGAERPRWVCFLALLGNCDLLP